MPGPFKERRLRRRAGPPFCVCESEELNTGDRISWAERGVQESERGWREAALGKLLLAGEAVHGTAPYGRVTT